MAKCQAAELLVKMRLVSQSLQRPPPEAMKLETEGLVDQHP